MLPCTETDDKCADHKWMCGELERQGEEIVMLFQSKDKFQKQIIVAQTTLVLNLIGIIVTLLVVLLRG